MVNKKITFSASELNSSGSILLKDVFMVDHQSHVTWDHTGVNRTEVIDTYIYPSGLMVKNSTGVAVAISLLSSGEVVTFNSGAANSPIELANGDSFNNIFYPLPTTFQVWARSTGVSATADLDLLFMSYSKE
jgi:hypothetical protein